MFDRLAAHWPPTIRNLSARTRRGTIAAAAVIPALLLGVLGSAASGAPQDSGLVACAYPLSTQDVPVTAYPAIRAQFAGSRWPDLRTAGRPTSIWPCSSAMREGPTDTRPSGSISGCPPPAPSTDGDRQHPGLAVVPPDRGRPVRDLRGRPGQRAAHRARRRAADRPGPGLRAGRTRPGRRDLPGPGPPGPRAAAPAAADAAAGRPLVLLAPAHRAGTHPLRARPAHRRLLPGRPPAAGHAGPRAGPARAPTHQTTGARHGTVHGLITRTSGCPPRPSRRSPRTPATPGPTGSASARSSCTTTPTGRCTACSKGRTRTPSGSTTPHSACPAATCTRSAA